MEISICAFYSRLLLFSNIWLYFHLCLICLFSHKWRLLPKKIIYLFPRGHSLHLSSNIIKSLLSYLCDTTLQGGRPITSVRERKSQTCIQILHMIIFYVSLNDWISINHVFPINTCLTASLVYWKTKTVTWTSHYYKCTTYPCKPRQHLWTHIVLSGSLIFTTVIFVDSQVFGDRILILSCQGCQLI